MVQWRKNPWLIRVAIATILFWVICSSAVLWRFYTFFPTDVSFDQGIFNQVFWNSLHGRFFESSLSATESSAVLYDNAIPDVSYRRLAQHFTPSLLLWLPIYALFPSPAGLSILQITLVMLGGWVLYALARQYHAPAIAALITISYYGANAVIGPTVANFNDFCQIPLMVFGLLLALEKRWWWCVGALSILTLMIREDTGIVLFGIGAYLLLSRRHPWIGGLLCGISVLYIAVLTTMVMPSFANDISRRFMVEQYGQFATGDNPSTLAVLWGILSNPLRLLVELVSPIAPTLNYLLGHWLPLAFVPSLSPTAWTIAGLPLFNILIQNTPASMSFQFRYALAVVPGLFYGAILWWAAHPHALQPRLQRFWIGCIALAIVFTLIANPNRAFSAIIPDSVSPWIYITPARQWHHAQTIRELLAVIPPAARVSATGHLVAHLSNRREVLRFPALRLRGDDQRAQRVQYVVADLWYPQQFQIAFAGDRAFLASAQDQIGRMIGNSRYRLIAFEDGVVLLQWDGEPNPDAITRWTQFLQP